MFENITNLQNIKNNFPILKNANHPASEVIKEDFLQTKIYNAPTYSQAITSKGALIDLTELAKQVSQQEIERLAIHEITVHAFRRFNGELIEAETGLPLKNNWPSYLATEEGMASFIEIQSGYKDINTLRKYAARILTVDAGFNGESFNQIFDLLVSYNFEQSESFDIVWRCFRRGGYLKDGEYWKGLHQIQQIHETNPERIKRLFAGKVNHEYFHLLEDKIPQELYDKLKLPVCLR